jgi:hypothetical protein
MSSLAINIRWQFVAVVMRRFVMNRSKVLLFILLFLTACSSAPAGDYVVSGIVYAFDTTNPSVITSVAFDLDKPATAVNVVLTLGGNKQRCESAAPFTHWTCPLNWGDVTGVSAMQVNVER